MNSASLPNSIDIVGIGVSVLDSVFLIDSLPKSGTVTRAQRRMEGVGGGVTVAIATAARLGSSTAMIDSLGDDQASKQIIASLQDLGVDTSGVACHHGASASVASIWSETDSAERTIVYCPGTAPDRLQWSDRIEQLVAGARIVHLNGRHGEVSQRAIQIAKQRQSLVSFDGGAYRYRDEILPAFHASDLVITAKQFAQSHFSRRTGRNVSMPARELTDFLMADLGCDVVGVTDGAAGSHLLARGQKLHFQPAIAPELAVDTTGCGDTFHGAFMHAYAVDQDVARSAEVAAEAASKNARVMGALAFDQSVAGSTNP